MAANPNISRKHRATAVIAVHGVGDHTPFQTARAIGDLLQELTTESRDPTIKRAKCADPGPEKPRYNPFREQGLRINVNPVVMHEEDKSARPTRETTRGPFNAWVQKQLCKEKQRQAQKKEQEKAQKQKDHGADKEADQARVQEDCRPSFDLHTEFMKGQLMCYGGDDPKDTYETIRLEGERAPSKEGDPQHDLHIYELYWADLSRLKAGLFSIFTELYQLLFHLSSVGTHTVNAAMLQHLESRRWRWFRNLQSWSSVTLTVPVPILNIIMLGIAMTVAGLAILLKAGTRPGMAFVAAVSGAVGAAFLGGLLWLWMKRNDRKIPFFIWVIPLVAGTLISAWIFTCDGIGDHIAGIEAVIMGLLAALGCVALLWQYNQRRPGLKKWTIGILLGVLAVFGISLCIVNPSKSCGVPHPIQVLLRLFESAYSVLFLAWAILFFGVILTWIAGLLAAGLHYGDKDTRSRWTCFLLLSLPTLLFSAVTLLGWVILVQAVAKLLPPIDYISFLPGINASSIPEFVTNLSDIPFAGMLPTVLAAIGIAALPAVWSMLPVVLSEVLPPTPDTALKADISERLGLWLSMAYRYGLCISGIFLFAVSTFGLPAIALLQICTPDKLIGNPALQSIGVFTGALLTWVFLARGSLKKLALGFRPVLDILLDVDNWLREHPLNKNPKARICGRYISLLRYICNWKSDDHPGGYDKILIVAHSQGTVITADLLRFLNRKTENGQTYGELDGQLKQLTSKQLPVSFFSMGCPLRQLYGRRFPYLYGWASHEFTDPMDVWKEKDLQFQFGTSNVVSPGPDPDELGVSLWVNAFRSGDYVGRNLWRTDNCKYLWWPNQAGTPVTRTNSSISTDGQVRMEFCIGAGAHTHYWDSTAPMIATELDRLIDLQA
jgi:hypothetical protein